LQELFSKLGVLRSIYRARSRNGMLVEKQNNISWLLQGRTHVNIAAVTGVAEVLVNDEGIYLIANNIEASRLMREEFPFELQVKEYFWYETDQRSRIISSLTEGIFLKDAECENEIREARLMMTPEQKTTYIKLGRDTADAMQEACFALTQGMTEFKAAAIVMEKCMERGIEPIVVLVAADERINLYRHPLPTKKTIDDYVMVVIGGRRYGQTACLTRFVAFSEPSEKIKRRRDAVLNLDVQLIEETRPGNSTGRIFTQLVDAYKSEGFPDEWKLHHQGGLTGYNSREIKAGFDGDIPVKTGQVYAWNPSITGFKAEDTFIVGDGSNLVLTETGQLPCKAVKYMGKVVQRPDILVRKPMK
jgi:Xaa-Pro aminopeptidase